MEKTYVTSSNIDQLGYYQGTLFIQFKSGAAYKYDQAPYHVYQILAKAESVGSAFHRFVKGRYRYTKLEANPF